MYNCLSIDRPDDPSMDLPLLRYRLTEKTYKSQLRSAVQQIAVSMGCPTDTAQREVRKIQQCELPKEVRALILTFSKTSVITNGCLNSKGAGIPEFVRSILVEFMIRTLKANKYVSSEKIEQIAAVCIS